MNDPQKTTGSVVIRKAGKADKPRIFELLEQANMHHIPSQEMPGLTFENYYVAMVNDKVAGFCGYKILSATTAKTELMVVDRAYRGLGIGYRLQEFRMTEMLQRGIELLTTNTDRPQTIAWYEKHFGYKPVGTLKKAHPFGDPDIDTWQTLQVNLQDWAARSRDGNRPDGSIKTRK